MAYLLPVKNSFGTQTVGIELNASNRINIYDDAGAIAFEVVNIPDTTPALGAKFPVYDSDGVAYDLFTFLNVTSGTVISETLPDGVTPGDARTRARYLLNDGEAWAIKARVTDADGFAYSYQAFVSVVVTVYDLSTGSVDVYTPADPALAAIFTTSLQAWSYDSYGYNLMFTILPSEMTGATEGCHSYKAEINLVLNAGGSKIVEAMLVTRSEMGA